MKTDCDLVFELIYLFFVPGSVSSIGGAGSVSSVGNVCIGLVSGNDSESVDFCFKIVYLIFVLFNFLLFLRKIILVIYTNLLKQVCFLIF